VAVQKAGNRVVVAVAVVASVGTAQLGATHRHWDRPYVAPEVGRYGGRWRQDMLHSSVSWSLGGSRSREQKEGGCTPFQAIERPSPPQQHRKVDGAAEKLEADVAAKAGATEKLEVDDLAKAVTGGIPSERFYSVLRRSFVQECGQPLQRC
jgi:hypothetical protein